MPPLPRAPATRARDVSHRSRLQRQLLAALQLNYGGHFVVSDQPFPSPRLVGRYAGGLERLPFRRTRLAFTAVNRLCYARAD
jgi:hypothetical protein